LYDNATIVLMNMIAANRFLAQYTPTSQPNEETVLSGPKRLRSLEFCMSIYDLLVVFRWSHEDDEWSSSSEEELSTNWERACRHLAHLPDLNALHVQFDNSMVTWHCGVDERSIFGSLANLRIKGKKRFTLLLPQPVSAEDILREREHGFPSDLGILEKGDLLEGEALKEVPFTVIRTKGHHFTSAYM